MNNFMRICLLCGILLAIVGCQVAQYSRQQNTFDIGAQSLISLIREKIKEQKWTEQGSSKREIVAVYHEPWHHEYQMAFEIYTHPDGKSSFKARLWSHTDISPALAWAVLYSPAWSGKARAKLLGDSLIASITGVNSAQIESPKFAEPKVEKPAKALTYKFCPVCQKKYPSTLKYCPEDGSELIDADPSQ